ncbi:MAG: ATP synthase F1 subunit epsilon [Proteobacteria bacterium]|nr:ATP synthase F1 subunit epsilon [Pseudomonadota bacterium]
MFTESKLRVKVLSASEELGDYPAWEVRIPSHKGEMGVRPSHSPLLGALSVGVVRIQSEQVSRGDLHWFFVSGGFFEITDSSLVLLVDTWEEASSIDFARADEARERALGHLKASDSKVDIPRALAALKRAEARLSLKEVLKHGGIAAPRNPSTRSSSSGSSSVSEKERAVVNA